MLVLEAGDVFQGSLFFTTYSGEAEAEMMNLVGLDAMMYGNHEFDLGSEPLAKFIETAKFPVLSGSVDTAGDKVLGPLARDHLELDVGGERVAILAATTTDTAEIASPDKADVFRDPVAYLTDAVKALEASGVNKIILVSHLGVNADIKVAEAVPGIDAIIGGHSHTLFSNTDPDAPYKYPLMVDRAGWPRRADRAGRRLLQVSRPPDADLRRRGQRHRRHRRQQAARRVGDPGSCGARPHQGAFRPDRRTHDARGRRNPRRHRRQPRDLPRRGMRDGRRRRRRACSTGSRARA